MARAIVWMLAAMLPLISLPAYACGAGFGDEVKINPQQRIVVTYRNGEETYIFQPHFCGKATDFGLILPVASTLTHDPSLTDSDLMDQLDVVTAPTIKTVETCESSGCGMGSSKGDGASLNQASGSADDGVDVISSGQVGDFQWQLLHADSAQSFTDWLDASHFPYPTSATAAFDHYVKAGWYFVAFSVKAGASAPPAGYRLCGDFGPIQLSFNSTQPVIPARMAAAGDTQSNFIWRLFMVSQHQYSVTTNPNTGQLTQPLRYAGALSAEDLSNAPAAAKIANQGEWLTALDLNFYAANLTDDFWLKQTANDATYRSTETHYKEVTCGAGCSIKQTPSHRRAGSGGLLVVAGLALIGGARRWWRVVQQRD
jgi:hypothetical protein